MPHPLGDYLSERAEDEYVNSEWRREMRELGGAAPEKKRGLVESYKRAGLTEADATKCVDALATVDEVFVAHTMMTRLQLIPPDEWTEGGLEHGGKRADNGDDDEGLSLAFKKGCTTAASFAVFGATPLVAYYAGQDCSTSLQHECFRSDAREKSTHALSSPREMIARPKMSQNE